MSDLMRLSLVSQRGVALRPLMIAEVMLRKVYLWFISKSFREMAQRIRKTYEVAMALPGPSFVYGGAMASREERTE
jgi:hypothetical protein